jgi:hypothetical protein
MHIPEDQWVVLDEAELVGEDFSRRRFFQFSAVGSRFESCRFERVRIESASFGAGRATSEYLDCTFDGARLRMGPGGFARFVRCSFREVQIRDWFGFAVELVDCTFSGRLRKAFFNGTVPTDQVLAAGRSINEFKGNDFSEMDLVDVSFRTGIDLTQQRLPTGPQYLFVADAMRAVAHARAQVIAWEDLELRQQAMPVLRVLEAEVERGQRQLLLRVDDFPPRKRPAAAAVFALMAVGD